MKKVTPINICGYRSENVKKVDANRLAEAVRGEQTLSELSARYGVHPNLIANWKKQARESLVDIFNGGGQKRDAQHDAEIKELHAKIGELTVEKDYLAKAFGR